MSSETLGGDTTCPPAEGTAEMPELHPREHTTASPAPLLRSPYRLRPTPTRGLTRADAAQRLVRLGPNRLREERVTPAWRVFLGSSRTSRSTCSSPRVAIAALQGQVVEALAILAILLLNGVLGFVQESRAASALSALKQLSAPVATVVRDGVEADIPADELVVGDVVMLEAGDAVPADGRLIEAAALRIIEAALTGESESSLKDATALAAPDAPLGEQIGMVFAGTTVAVGRGRFVVTATGPATQMGHIADLLAETPEEETPLQVELDRVGKRIALIVLAVAAIVFAEEALVALPRCSHEPGIARRPRGPGIPQRADGRAARRSLARRRRHPRGASRDRHGRALARRATHGRAQCDRPATSRGRDARLHDLHLRRQDRHAHAKRDGRAAHGRRRRRVAGHRRPVSSREAGRPHDADFALLLEMAAANNDARAGADGALLGDPTETALLVAARLARAQTHPADSRIADLPFDSQRKRMTTVHETSTVASWRSRRAAPMSSSRCARTRSCAARSSRSTTGSASASMSRTRPLPPTASVRLRSRCATCPQAPRRRRALSSTAARSRRGRARPHVRRHHRPRRPAAARGARRHRRVPAGRHPRGDDHR